MERQILARVAAPARRLRVSVPAHSAPSAATALESVPAGKTLRATIEECATPMEDARAISTKARASTVGTAARAVRQVTTDCSAILNAPSHGGSFWMALVTALFPIQEPLVKSHAHDLPRIISCAVVMEPASRPHHHHHHLPQVRLVFAFVTTHSMELSVTHSVNLARALIPLKC